MMLNCKNKLVTMLSQKCQCKIFTIAFALLALVGCATDNSSVAATSKANASNSNSAFAADASPSLAQLIANKGSMTTALKSLHHDFTVQLLKTGVEDNNYVRISSLKLDGTPVLAAITSTNLNNPTFVNILKNASTTPIGQMLFAPNAQIYRRDNMQIKTIDIRFIQNSCIYTYLTKTLGYQGDRKIVVRQSQFYHQNETLDITEYILPSITQFTSK